MSQKCFHEEILSGLDLSNIDFNGSSFYKTNFIGKNTFIKGSMFRDVDFRYANFRNVDLSNSSFERADFHHADLCFANLSRGNFRQANLDDTRIDGAILDETTGLKSNSFGDKIFEEKKMDYIVASEIYLSLRKNFENIGDYDSSSWAYYRERSCKRKSHGIQSAYRFYRKQYYKETNDSSRFFSKFLFWLQNKSHIIWFRNLIQEWLWGYAQKPTRILFWSLFLIILFSFIYWAFGLVCFGEAACMPDLAYPNLYKNWVCFKRVESQASLW